ncbi:hypothetical protein Lal_00013093, partial [Lupinus albus]
QRAAWPDRFGRGVTDGAIGRALPQRSAGRQGRARMQGLRPALSRWRITSTVPCRSAVAVTRSLAGTGIAALRGVAGNDQGQGEGLVGVDAAGRLEQGNGGIGRGHGACGKERSAKNGSKRMRRHGRKSRVGVRHVAMRARIRGARTWAKSSVSTWVPPTAASPSWRQHPQVIENREGARTTPSIIAYMEDGEILVGAPAKRQAVTNPKNTLYAVKRLIGRKFEERGPEGHRPDAVHHHQADNGDAWVEVRGRSWRRRSFRRSPAQDEETAEDYLGEEVTEAVITVPAYFNDASARHQGGRPHRRPGRQAHHQRADRGCAGIRPRTSTRRATARSPCTTSAAARSTSRSSRLPTWTAKAVRSAVDQWRYVPGREDFDQRIIDYIIGEFKKEQGVDLSKDVLALQRLKEAAEKAKIELSTRSRPKSTCPLVGRPDRPHDRSVPHRHQGCRREGVGHPRRDLVGGMTRMPKVQEKVKEFFGKEARKDVNPDEPLPWAPPSRARCSR